MDSTEVLSKSDMWEQRIRDYHLSGLACKEWCEQNQVSVSTIGYWIRKQKAVNNLVGGETIFAKLPSEDEVISSPALPAPITIHLGCILIEVAAGCPPELLSGLVGVLKNDA